MFKTKFAQAWVISLVASIWFTSFVSAAEPKKAGDRGSVGDLVEFTTGMGPMLGEVINGPDPSNYYMILVPGQGELPMNGSKLRLIQRAGTPNAAFKPGDEVGIREGNTVTRGNVVRVNGKWCQVKAQLLDGWVECSELRTAKKNTGAKDAAAAPSDAPAAPSSEAAKKAGPSPLVGTYENADGKTVLEFLAEGKAYLSFHGVTNDCSHSGNVKKVTVTCDGVDTAFVFTVNSDGSLAGPPDSFITRMKKKP